LLVEAGACEELPAVVPGWDPLAVEELGGALGPLDRPVVGLL
jgi:hypothetical protein